MKKFWTIALALLLVVAMVAGCAPAADAPAADAPAAEAPKAEEPKAEEPAAEEPAADSGEEKLILAFVATGVAPFNDPMYPGMDKFQEQHPEVVIEEYANADGSYEGWAQILDTLVARKDEVSGIITGLYAGDSFKNKAKEVWDAGIPLIGIGSPSVEGAGMPFAWCTDVKTAAYEGAIYLCEEMGGEGNIIHVAGDAHDINTQARCEGVEEAIAEYPGCTLIQTISDVDNAELALNAVNNVLAAGNEVNGFIATGGGCSVGMAQALTQHGDKNIKAVGCDFDDPTLEAIRGGFVSGTMAQNAYAMAYNAAHTLWRFAQGYTYAYEGEYYQSTGTVYVTAENADGIGAALEEACLENSAAGNLDKVLNAP